MFTAQAHQTVQVDAGQGAVPTIKAHVRQVLVPVVVTDKKGHPISGLKNSDFVVFENDVQQQIIAFSKTYDSALEVAGLPVIAGPVPARSVRQEHPSGVGPDSPLRTYLVCVDSLHSSFGNLTQARRALIRLFQSEHDGDAQYALMNLSRQIEVLQDSTRDPSLVLSALASKKFQSSILEGESSGIISDADTLRKMLMGVIPIPPLDLKHQVQMFINARAERTAIITRIFQQELKTIVEATASMPTQRIMVLISDGFTLAPGRELVGIARAYFPDALEFKFIERDSQPQLTDLLRIVQKNNIVVYAMDSRGLYTPASTGLGDASHSGDAISHGGALNAMITDEGTVAWENGSAMAQLAQATGGIYFHDNNDLLAGLHRAFDDERERYVIVYEPSNDSLDGKYRKIRVDVKKQNLRVLAKAGYWATEK